MMSNWNEENPDLSGMVVPDSEDPISIEDPFSEVYFPWSPSVLESVDTEDVWIAAKKVEDRFRAKGETVGLDLFPRYVPTVYTSIYRRPCLAPINPIEQSCLLPLTTFTSPVFIDDSFLLCEENWEQIFVSDELVAIMKILVPTFTWVRSSFFLALPCSYG